MLTGLELLYILKWWGMLLVLSLLFQPWTAALLPRLPGAGTVFAKPLGIAMVGYTLFLLGMSGIPPFSQSIRWLLLIVIIAVDLTLLRKFPGLIKPTQRHRTRAFIFSELLFLATFLIAVYLRSTKPEIVGLEKFMDMGFVNSILRSNQLPPQDLWMAGQTINYYWFGHLITAMLIAFVQIPASIGFNLMLATIFALVFSSGYALVLALVRWRTRTTSGVSQCLVGLLGAAMVTLSGNLQPLAWHFLKRLQNCNPTYWFTSATRLIGYCPPTADKTISEFPAYTFIVSDLHAHLLNLPFVLLLLALLFQMLSGSTRYSPWHMLLAGLLIGIFAMTNAWDVPIYLLLAGIGVLFVQLGNGNTVMRSLAKSTVFVLLLAFAGWLFSLPFSLQFSAPVNGVHLVQEHSPLWQLAILWGIPFLMSLCYLLLWPHHLGRKGKITQNQGQAISVLLTCGWILILIPEVIYLADIYGPQYHRANTMFKLSYQAFLLFTLATLPIMVHSMSSIKNLVKWPLRGFFIVILALALWYPVLAIKGFYSPRKETLTLDGMQWLRRQFPDSYQAIEWINHTIRGRPVIVEAAGKSFTLDNRISTYTGLPTVAGWFAHEWLWRNSNQEISRRKRDVEQIYRLGTTPKTRQILNKYQVRYLVVGKTEQDKYGPFPKNHFQGLGHLVFTTGRLSIYRLNETSTGK